VLQCAGFVLREDDDLPGPFCESLEHGFLDPPFDIVSGVPFIGCSESKMYPWYPTIDGTGFGGTFARRHGYPSPVVDPCKVLITGGAGFIGSHLAELLLAEGREVWALDDLSTGSLENVERLRNDPRFHLVVDSVLSPAVVNELVHKCDVVFHLAAAVGVRLIVERPVHTLVTNIQGTEVVLEHCNRFGKRVLIASTSEVYGDHREERPLSEDDRRVYGPTTQRRWAYADSKAMDEFLALAHAAENGLDCVIVRLFNTVGPRQSGQYGMVVPNFVRRALAGEALEIHGDGTQTRCFCHVQDTIRALAGLMRAAPAGEIYNAGSTERISINDLAARVIDATGSSSELVHVPYERVYEQGIEDMLHRIPSIEKIGAAIGWAPTRTLADILDDVIAFERSTLPSRSS
jgi:UDP-glucose 4-epimerase